MVNRALTPAAAPKTYAELKRGVEEVVFAGRQRIEEAWLRTYHDAGRLISEHLLLNQDRAEYGAKVFNRLAQDTGISKRVLYECVQLFRYFPIVRTSAQLSRSHYQLLCQVAGKPERDGLLTQTIKNQWTVAELTSRVRTFNAELEAASNGSNGANGDTPPAAVMELLTPQRGTPGLHLVVDRGAEGLAIDLGFKLYQPLTPEQAKRLEKGTIVRLGEDRITRADAATKADLFAYAATIRRIVDGDTLVIAIEVAPGIFLEEKLRLRGLDCPEMSTAEGRAAKRYTESVVRAGQPVVIHTTKPDKYDRYLADVFASGAEDDTAGESVFLNNALLQQGHALRKDTWEFGDWGSV